MPSNVGDSRYKDREIRGYKPLSNRSTRSGHSSVQEPTSTSHNLSNTSSKSSDDFLEESTREMFGTGILMDQSDISSTPAVESSVESHANSSELVYGSSQQFASNQPDDSSPDQLPSPSATASQMCRRDLYISMEQQPESYDPDDLHTKAADDANLDEVFIGAQRKSSLQKFLRPNEFRLYYEKPKHRADIPLKLPLSLAYMSSVHVSGHLYAIDELPEKLASDGLTFATLSALMNYHKIYSFTHPKTGKPEAFPIWLSGFSGTNSRLELNGHFEIQHLIDYSTDNTTTTNQPLGQQTTTADSASLVQTPNIVGLPANEAIERPTEEDIPKPDEEGEYTEQLSDYTDNDVDLRQKYSHTGALTWYRRVQPLMRNKRVRVYAVANFIFLLINVMLLLALVVIAVLAVVNGIQAASRLRMDKPCLYEFGSWSSCPATCTSNGTTNWRIRKVIPSTIVYARGRFARDAPCPEDVENLVEKAPCNTHACPILLSAIDYKKDCWRNNANDKNAGCYRIRDIPIGDYSVTIDTTDLIEWCECP
ncbi:hypothetical protein M3Y96_00153400 [Aphelenchoides besseyi]|nr:hypothetical protein M3Y96_00153400 [Aphelenchoides besseyi]